MKSLVTGGVRSGKSFHAESLVVAEPHVTYIAPGREADPAADPSHAARVVEHQARRPSSWVTVESHGLADAVCAAEGAVIVDCVGDWVQWLIGELDGWDATREEWEPRFMQQVETVAEAVAARRDTVVLVTQEVGMGAVTDDWRARLFRDLLGFANQRLAMECDEVLLVVAGRVLRL
ncbi:adenosylcobinamide kinase/adenosylcobinamide phosphate guanyltransferase [Aeromicrobium sp. PE09-221]|uniref:bifunctional adenosylcobinamide kinase/adenosylcobinamide-phosphate guanylyltransferase n=1 Tax=Aeromicrobium sp. PE09-221 TaxID=1898043 RepID=UPI000B3E99D8|nr:bifunctional adenosylcobinamide kinase/adenosylcobinamide-phosphate guanylyltransferase [Aeromicrobium sp. PE09-221]OUZ07505.1 adenosylcobinamide kinase/adenosylcobinamide phosphate guanyltransferase [Aeromicrobium sp. PE09-221]